MGFNSAFKGLITGKSNVQDLLQQSSLFWNLLGHQWAIWTKTWHIATIFK